jgi:hypothetical protein
MFHGDNVCGADERDKAPARSTGFPVCAAALADMEEVVGVMQTATWANGITWEFGTEKYSICLMRFGSMMASGNGTRSLLHRREISSTNSPDVSPPLDVHRKV